MFFFFSFNNRLNITGSLYNCPVIGYLQSEKHGLTTYFNNSSKYYNK